MKFVCDNCHARYSIDDERVRGRSLTIRCRKCAHLIKVSAPSAPAAAEASAPEGDDHWYYSVNGESVGPMSRGALEDVFRSGRHGDEAHIWHPSMEGWIPVAEEASLREALATGSRSRRRVAAPKTMRLDARALLKESLQDLSKGRTQQADPLADAAADTGATPEPSSRVPVAKAVVDTAPDASKQAVRTPSAASNEQADVTSPLPQTAGDAGADRARPSEGRSPEHDAVERDPLFSGSTPPPKAVSDEDTEASAPSRSTTASGTQPAVPRLSLPRPSRPSTFATRLPKSPLGGDLKARLQGPSKQAKVDEAATKEVAPATDRSSDAPITSTPEVSEDVALASRVSRRSAPSLPTTPSETDSESDAAVPLEAAGAEDTTHPVSITEASTVETPTLQAGAAGSASRADHDQTSEASTVETPALAPFTSPTRPAPTISPSEHASKEPPGPTSATPEGVSEDEAPSSTLHLGTVPRRSDTPTDEVSKPTRPVPVEPKPSVAAAPASTTSDPPEQPNAPAETAAPLAHHGSTASPVARVPEPASAEHEAAAAAVVTPLPEARIAAVSATEESGRKPVAIALLAAAMLLLGVGAVVWFSTPSETLDVPLAPVMVTTSPGPGEAEVERETDTETAPSAPEVDMALVQAGLRRIDRAVASALEQGRSSMALAASESQVARAQARQRANRHAQGAAPAPRPSTARPDEPSAAGAPEPVERISPQLHAPSAGLQQGALAQRRGSGPQVRQQMVRASGGPDAAFFRDSISRFMPAAVQRCNRRHMQSEGEPLRERVEIEFHILPSGEIASIIPRNRRIADTAFFRCLNLERRHWQIPAFEGDSVRVTQPYVLN